MFVPGQHKSLVIAYFKFIIIDWSLNIKKNSHFYHCKTFSSLICFFFYICYQFAILISPIESFALISFPNSYSCQIIDGFHLFAFLQDKSRVERKTAVNSSGFGLEKSYFVKFLNHQICYLFQIMP